MCFLDFLPLLMREKILGGKGDGIVNYSRLIDQIAFPWEI